MALLDANVPSLTHRSERHEFATMLFGAGRATRGKDACEAGPCPLSAEELASIAIGKADAAKWGWEGSTYPAGGWQRAARLLLSIVGKKPVQSLANERLETLRLLACVTRRTAGNPRDLTDRLVRLGMTRDAIAFARRLAGT